MPLFPHTTDELRAYVMHDLMSGVLVSAHALREYFRGHWVPDLQLGHQLVSQQEYIDGHGRRVDMQRVYAEGERETWTVGVLYV